MSGHSKWSTIKRQKGLTDNKRGQVFTKLANFIVLAAKSGGGIDPEMNFKLRLAIDKARIANMPKYNIDRAIARALGNQDGALEEVFFEGFIPGGAAVIVEGVTDKRQRTVAEIKNLFDKNGGVMGVPGSVSYLFSRVGEIVVSKNGKNEEEIISAAMEAGVDDFEDDEEVVQLFCRPELLQSVKKTLEEIGFLVLDASTIYKPLANLKVEDAAHKQRAFDLLEKLDDHDDVQKTYTNMSI